MVSRPQELPQQPLAERYALDSYRFHQANAPVIPARQQANKLEH
jgi:hypothetical protein